MESTSENDAADIVIEESIEWTTSQFANGLLPQREQSLPSRSSSYLSTLSRLTRSSSTVRSSSPQEPIPPPEDSGEGDRTSIPSPAIELSRSNTSIHVVALGTASLEGFETTKVKLSSSPPIASPITSSSSQSDDDSVSASSNASSYDLPKKGNPTHRRSYTLLLCVLVIGMIMIGGAIYFYLQRTQQRKVVNSNQSVANALNGEPQVVTPVIATAAPSIVPVRPPSSPTVTKPVPIHTNHTIKLNPTSAPVSNVPTLVPTTAYPTNTPTESTFVATFIALGDAPYNRTQEGRLRRQLDDINYENIDFVIHVGDFRKAEGDCYLDQYETASEILRRSPVPVFVIPGDNDWTDCPDMDQGWDYYSQTFLSFEDYWDHDFEISRHPNRPETFTFVHKQILFIGLNIAGDTPDDEDEWYNRLTEQVEWTIELITDYTNNLPESHSVGRVVIFGHADPTSYHDAFFGPLTDFMYNELEDGIPILYLNGDTHVWSYDSNFYEYESLLRIMVPGETNEPPIEMRVYATGDWQDTNEAFVYDRRLESMTDEYSDESDTDDDDSN